LGRRGDFDAGWKPGCGNNSIVTPSFIQGRFLESFLRSVLDQAYPALEYFVMDGGSADESAEIIRCHAYYC
jgi:glycosyltransferase involved in cell wall biosynthesis